MKNLLKYAEGIMLITIMADMVLTPEQKAEMRRRSDWEYYASRYTD